MKRLALAIFIVTQFGCGGKGGGSSGGSSSTPKSVWSTWTYTSGGNSAVLDLNGGQFGVQQGFGIMFLPSTAVCTCQFIANGDNSSGNYTFSSCTYSSGGSGDPGCASLNTTGTYTNDGTTLTACDSSCASYH